MDFSIELISSMIFFVGLISVYSLRNIFIKYTVQSYHNIIVGLGTLSLSSAFSHLFVHNLSDMTIAYVHPLIMQTVYWTGTISGVILLVSGTSTWLPIYRKEHALYQNNLKKIKLFKQLEKIIRYENRNPVIILQALELILKSYNLYEAGCYLFSQREQKFSFIGSVTNDETDYTEQCSLIQFDYTQAMESVHEENFKTILSFDKNNSYPNSILQIISRNRFLGFVALYADHEIEKTDIDKIKLLLEIISDKILRDSLELQNKELIANEQFISQVNSYINLENSFDENIRKCKSILSEQMQIDYLALSLPSDSYMPKFIVSEYNQILADYTNRFTQSEELEKYVTEYKQPVVIDNIEKETYIQVDITALKADIKSMIALPVLLRDGNMAVLVAGSKEYATFKRVQSQRLQTVAQILEPVISSKLIELENKSDRRFENRIYRLLIDSVKQHNQNALYQNICHILKETVLASIVRISDIDEDNRFLRSQAMSTDTTLESTTPSDASMMLALMPLHRQVIRSRKVELIKKNNANKNEFFLEERQLFGHELTQMITAPIQVDSQIVGLLSLGFQKDPSMSFDKILTKIDQVVKTLNLYLQFEHQRDNKINENRRVQISNEISGRDTAGEFSINRYIANVRSEFRTDSDIYELIEE